MILSTIIFGLVLGGIYALIAIGLTIQYGVARIMNLAYGELVILGSFATFLVVTKTGLNPFLALLIVAPIGFVFSYALYSIIMEPLEKRSKNRGQLEVDSILVTFGLLFFIEGSLALVFGGGFTGYTWLEKVVDIFGAKIELSRVIGAVFALVIGATLYILMKKTHWGMAMRAIATRPQNAIFVGIDQSKYARFAFALGGALATVGGVVLSMYQPFTPTLGVFFTMKALIIIIMGGVGNLAGTIVAALILGLIETFVSAAVDPGLTLAATYAIFLSVLIWRPQGLFSRA
jgi:branched-chain amino acid transport system permease protein